MSLVPTATYTAPDIVEQITFHPGHGEHSTNGKTTQISDVVLNAGGEDRDRPTEAKDTPLGQLRAKLTTIQDDLNVFLTARMQQDKNSKEQEEIERRILDDGVDEDDSD